jgi:hypothetical protein
MRVALAGSGDLPLDRTARHVLMQLTKLPDGSSVLLRHPKTKGRPPGGFERMVARIAAPLRIEVVWCRPEGAGRDQVYHRDLNMVTRADYAVAFFTTPEMVGGTGHVVEAAWAKGVSVEAWWITPDGSAERIGEYDPATDGP